MSDKPGSNPAVWDLEATDPEACEKLRAGLNEVLDPEIGLSVIQLGLIRNFRYQDGEAVLKMILTTPFCPYGPALIDMTRVKAEEALGVPVSVELGMDVWDFAMMEEGLDMEWGLY
ncbi:MAG TPA: iron-sulfur cluster assembly protein [Bellilinea sp.]